MLQILGYALVILLAYLAHGWARGPRARLTEPEIKEMAIGDGGVPPTVEEFFRYVAAQLRPMGFRDAGRFLAKTELGELTPYVVVLENTERAERCLAIARFGKVGRAEMKRTYGVRFETRLPDGRMVVTTNTKVLCPLAAVPWRVHNAFLGIDNVGFLKQVHDTICSRQGHGQSAAPFSTSWKEDFLFSWKREADYAIEAGLVKRGGWLLSYRSPTWGKIVGWPAYAITQYRRGPQEETATLRDLGLPLEYANDNWRRSRFTPRWPTRQKDPKVPKGLGPDGRTPQPFRLDLLGRINEDLACPECGYSLRELQPTGKCPECGQRPGHSAAGGLLRLCPLWWIRALADAARGLSLSLAALIATSGSAVILFFKGGTGEPLAYLLMISALLSLCGIAGSHVLLLPGNGPHEGAFLRRRITRACPWVGVLAFIALFRSDFRYALWLTSYVTGPVAAAMILSYVKELALRIPNPAIAREASLAGVCFVSWSLLNVGISCLRPLGALPPIGAALGAFYLPLMVFVRLIAPYLLLGWSVWLIWRFRRELLRIEREICELCDTEKEDVDILPEPETAP